MAGHSKWSNIKHKKGIEDKKKAKVFTKHAKYIAVAAKGGADPDMNPLLRAAIDNARAANLPKENIERAIKKGSGEGDEAVNYQEIVYEALGPNGVAILIEVLTDNRNRAFGDVKLVVNKKGGRMAEANSVLWMFERVGRFLVEGELSEEVELGLIDCGASGIEKVDDGVVVICALEDFAQVRTSIERLGLKILESRLVYLPKNSVEIEMESESGKSLVNMIEGLEEIDDVVEVFTNLA